MKHEKLYLIAEDTYHQHIDQEVHLYGLLHQLAFLAGKIKESGNTKHLIDTVIRYGQIAEEKFATWDIPGRYLIYGDKADLHTLKEKELVEVICVPEDDTEEELEFRDMVEELLCHIYSVTDGLETVLAQFDAEARNS